MEKINFDIKKQIAKTNEGFANLWGREFYDGLLTNDNETLEILLVKASKNYKAYKILSIVSSILLLVFLLLMVLGVYKFGKMTMNMNLLAIIVMTVSIRTSAHTFYKIKVNLENKIFLLKLASKLNLVI